MGIERQIRATSIRTRGWRLAVLLAAVVLVSPALGAEETTAPAPEGQPPVQATARPGPPQEGRSPAGTASPETAGDAAASVLPAKSAIDLEVLLEYERSTLSNLTSYLHTVEKDMAASQAAQHERRRKQFEDHPRRNANAPEKIEQPGLLVARNPDPGGMLYSVAARNIPMVRVMHAVSTVSGLPVTVDANLPAERFGTRVTINLQGSPLHIVLEFLTGMQDLDYLVDENGIYIASVAVLGENGPVARLRQKALENYERALVFYPSHEEAPGAYLGIARYHLHHQSYQTALQTLGALLQRFPDAIEAREALLLMGACREKLGRVTAARQSYFRYVDGYPESPDQDRVFMAIARTYIAEGDQERAVNTCDQLVLNWPPSRYVPEALLKSARCLMDLGDYGEALSRLDRLDHFPEFERAAEGHLMAATCLYQTEQYAPARMRLGRLLGHKPPNRMIEKAFLLFGDCCLADDDPLRALEAYDAALRTCADKKSKYAALVRVARCYERIGLIEPAERTLRRVPEKWRNTDEIRNLILRLARHYTEIDHVERGMALLQSVTWTETNISPADILLCRAGLFLQRGSPDLAIQECDRALREGVDAETRAKILPILGDAYRAKGQVAMALRAYGGQLP